VSESRGGGHLSIFLRQCYTYGILGPVHAEGNGAPMRNLTMWQAVAYATELGLAFATAVFLGLFVGHAADDWMRNEAPIFTTVGALLGFGAGVYSTAKLALMIVRPGKE
jgi:F0F1-type ATP synthase assembly protein I